MKIALYIVLILSLGLIALGVVPWICCGERPFVMRLIVSAIDILSGVAFAAISIENIKEAEK